MSRELDLIAPVTCLRCKQPWEAGFDEIALAAVDGLACPGCGQRHAVRSAVDLLIFDRAAWRAWQLDTDQEPPARYAITGARAA